jgi:hypothetical protein
MISSLPIPDNSFLFKIGEMSIDLKISDLLLKHQSQITGFVEKFISPLDKEAEVKNIINFSHARHASMLKNVLLHDNYFKLAAEDSGVIYIRFRNKDKLNPYISVRVSNCFSYFNLCLHPDSDDFPIIDPSRTAADPFLLQHTFINHQGLIIHAAGGSVQGKGMIFSGPSGAGKSTLSLLLESVPNNRLFSDERVIARSMQDGWHVWGTPWHGTGNIARNENAPLSALVFLTQAEETKITALPPSAGLRRLLQVVSIPWYSKEWTNKGLAVCESLIQAVPIFELAFRPDQTAAEAVERLASSLP